MENMGLSERLENVGRSSKMDTSSNAEGPQESINAQICVGVDPSFSNLPAELKKFKATVSDEEFLLWYGRKLMSASERTGVKILKFQSAYFEAFGWTGVKALETLCKEARGNGFFVIDDAKRGDISTTMEAYGKAAFERCSADALTVTPYMGADVITALEPWLRSGRFLYVVLVTSNPSGRELQLASEGPLNTAERVYDHLSSHFLHTDLWDRLGFVLGATQVDAINESFFEKLSASSLLLPGVGAQGASLTSPRARLILQNRRNLIPVSRAASGFGGSYKVAGVETVGPDDYEDFVAANISRIFNDLGPA